jgi:hypothetical protein
MDLSTAEQLNGNLWHRAKNGAFVCFMVACGLLGASLILPTAGGQSPLAAVHAAPHP